MNNLIYSKTDLHFCNNISDKIMNISLKSLLNLATLPGIVYLKKKNILIEAAEVDLYKLTPYKDYIVLPYIKDEVIYDAFLDSYHISLKKEKAELHKSDDFAAAFRRFIDNNKKYGHLLYCHYYDFEKVYLRPILIDWCKKNKIAYTDDLDS